MKDLTSALQLLPFFESNRERLADVDWLAGQLEHQCRYNKQGGGLLHAQQHPWELAEWLVSAAAINPASYIEIGVFKCGTFYITDSYLRATCPRYTHALAVDRRPPPETFAEYSSARDVRFASILSRHLQITEFYELAMIDAIHTLEAIRADFEKVKDSRLVGFHDLVFCKDRVDVVFNEIVEANPGRPSWTIVAPATSKRRTARFGIGAIQLKD